MSGRQFDVKINGATVISGLDIIAEVGGFAADVKTLTVSPSAGTLTIDLVVGGAGLPIISGIEILPLVATVTGVSPGSGPVTGGTVVTVTGTGFSTATAVFFGMTAAAAFTVNSDTSITATAPAEAAGTVDVLVTSPGGTSAPSVTFPDSASLLGVPQRVPFVVPRQPVAVTPTPGADQFMFLPAVATVTAVTPATGATAGGTTVLITGTNFIGVTGVTFGTSPAASFTVNSATQITATSPPGAAGVADIAVTNASGTSAVVPADQFTYTSAALPAVAAITPLTGPASGATVVTVSGSGFTGASAVTVNGLPAAGFTVISATAITVVTPPGTAGTGDIRVTTPAGISPIAAGDRYTYTAPVVTGGSVFTAPPGRWQFLVVTTTGSGLEEITSAKSRKVTFDLYKGASASFTINGLDPQAAIPQEIADDLVCLRDTRRLFLGRLGATDDTLDGTGHQTTFAAVDYRGMLDRRIIWPGSRTTFAQVDQRDIAWSLITDTQNLGTVGGGGINSSSLGITTSSVPTGVKRDRTYNEGDTIGTLLTDLSLVVGGFDWEVDAFKSFNIFYPLRGKPSGAGAVLSYGGNVSQVTRTIDTSTFANAIRYSGATGIPAAVAVARPGPEGRWEKQVGDTTVVLASTLVEKAAYELALDSTILPSYQVTLTGGWWTPELVWLGDYVTLVVKSGRLNITATLRVVTIDVTIDDTGHEVVVLTLGQSLGSFFDKLAKYTQRFQNLERR